MSDELICPECGAANPSWATWCVKDGAVLAEAKKSGPLSGTAYIEFRVGDDEDELGIIDRRYAPHRNGSPGGAIIYWHVDDLAAAVKDLVARGAKEHEPILERSDGFVTASVVDPFGNILGVMYNPHYVEINAVR